MKISEISTAKLDQYTKAANADFDKAKEQGDSKRMFKRGLNLMKASGKKIDNDVKAMQKARGISESEYGIPDETPGHLPGGPKMTFGEFKKMWPGVILKRPSGGSLAGSVVADVEGWMNNPKSVWEPLKSMAEGVKIVDQDSDLDQQIFTLNVDGEKVSFTYWDYEDKFRNPDITEIFSQAKEQLPDLTTEQHKDIARAVFKSFEQGIAEGMFGISAKEKGAIMNLTSKLSDIPNMWDHEAQTFTNLGKAELEKALNYNPKYIKYALNLTSKDYEADM